MATDAIAVRVEMLDRRVGRLEDTNPAVIASQLAGLRNEVAQLRDDCEEGRREAREEQRSTRRTMIGFAITVSLACIGVALSVVFSGGGIV